jgi:hypothetical protein
MALTIEEVNKAFIREGGIWVMILLIIPFLPEKFKNRKLNEVVDKLEQEEFEGFMELTILTMSKQKYKKKKKVYKQSVEEFVDSELKYFPRMQSYRNYFINIIRNNEESGGDKQN